MKRLFPLFLLLLLLALPGLACNALAGGDEPAVDPEEAVVVVEPTAEPVEVEETVAVATEAPPEPTQTPTPLPTNTPAPSPTWPSTPLPLPTAGAKGTGGSGDSGSSGDTGGTDSGGPTPVLSTTTYIHPQGFVSLLPPDGWSVGDDDSSAYFISPDGSGYIYVQVTNTVYELDGPAFATFVENRDLNYFGIYDDYTVLSQEVDQEIRFATVSKSFDYEGVPQAVITLYDQRGPIIFSFDFWSDEATSDAYSALYPAVIDTVEVNGETALDQVEYNWVYTFTGPGDLFTIEVPTPWRYTRDDGDVAIVDTFYAPDEHAVIQNITYDEGVEISRSEAGAFALQLLRDYYASDIRITDDQMQADGSERLTWNSPSGEYGGISFLETRGTTFLLFTVLYDDEYEDTYFETLTYTIESYSVPE